MNNVSQAINRVISTITIFIKGTVAVWRAGACFAQALFSTDPADDVLGLGDHLSLCQADLLGCGVIVIVVGQVWIEEIVVVMCGIIDKIKISISGKIHNMSTIHIAHIDIGASVDIVGEYIALMISKFIGSLSCGIHIVLIREPVTSGPDIIQIHDGNFIIGICSRIIFYPIGLIRLIK